MDIIININPIRIIPLLIQRRQTVLCLISPNF